MKLNTDSILKRTNGQTDEIVGLPFELLNTKKKAERSITNYSTFFDQRLTDRNNNKHIHQLLIQKKKHNSRLKLANN